MKNFVFIFLLTFLFSSCDKDTSEKVSIPLIASIEHGASVKLVLKTEKEYPKPGYVIAYGESTGGSKQHIRLKYIYQRFASNDSIPTPAFARIYATTEREQNYVVKYKNNQANIKVKYDGNQFSVESDNHSFIRPE